MSSGKEEINPYAAFHHLACYLFPVGVFGLEQFALCFNAMQVILVPQEQSARAPCR